MRNNDLCFATGNGLRAGKLVMPPAAVSVMLPVTLPKVCARLGGMSIGNFVLARAIVSAMSVQMRSQRLTAWAWGIVALVLVLLLVLVWGLNMRRGLNHDEHQFVASGALIAREGLLPYRDFPYFHVPTLSFLYALLFQATDYLLLTARSFSILCSWLTLVLIFAAALAWLPPLPAWWRVGIGAATAVLLMTTPSFLHASGRAWNHDFPILLTLLAAVGQVGWLKRTHGPMGPLWRLLWWPLAAGVLVGLAASARLTFAVAGAAFVLSVFLVLPWRTRQAWFAVGLFCAGGILGALPALYMLGVAPAQFIFGNLGYAQLNTAYYQQAAGGEPGAAMTLGGKLGQHGRVYRHAAGQPAAGAARRLRSLAGAPPTAARGRAALPAAPGPLFPRRRLCAHAHAAAVHLPALSAAGVDLPRRPGVRCQAPAGSRAGSGRRAHLGDPGRAPLRRRPAGRL